MPSATESSNIVSDAGLDDAGRRALANRGEGDFTTLVLLGRLRSRGFSADANLSVFNQAIYS